MPGEHGDRTSVVFWRNLGIGLFVPLIPIVGVAQPCTDRAFPKFAEDAIQGFEVQLSTEDPVRFAPLRLGEGGGHQAAPAPQLFDGLSPFGGLSGFSLQGLPGLEQRREVEAEGEVGSSADPEPLAVGAVAAGDEPRAHQGRELTAEGGFWHSMQPFA